MPPATAAYPQMTGKPPQASPNQTSEWKRPLEQLEVVGEDEEQADRHQRDEPESERERADDADRARRSDRRGCEGHQGRARNRGTERSAPQLVECMRADPHGERERGDDGAEPLPGDLVREAAADHDVRQMPGGVGRMQQRDVVAPAAPLQRVPGGPRTRRRAQDFAPT